MLLWCCFVKKEGRHELIMIGIDVIVTIAAAVIGPQVGDQLSYSATIMALIAIRVDSSLNSHCLSNSYYLYCLIEQTLFVVVSATP